MKRLVLDSARMFVIFVLCTFLFYFGLQLMQAEYKEMHRYDPPSGPAVKVSQSPQGIVERIQLLFNQGD